MKQKLPDKKGHFLEFGGRYVPETLMRALEDLTRCYQEIKKDKKFQAELKMLLQDYAGRPTPLYYARQLSERIGGARIFLKREDMCHTGAHKINSTIAQGLMAQRLGKKRIVAETGAGQHGVASATAARIFNLECDVYMGAEDIERQALNVYKMKLLGARVIPVHSGSKTLKDATNEAIRDWVTNVETTHYLLGSVVGPHPYPMMVRDFQCVIGREVKVQSKKKLGNLPDVMIACVGGGSNAIGFFHPLLDSKIKMFGVEAAGSGLNTGRHAASISKGEVGILHGMKSLLLQNRDGQVEIAHSVSAGLDYPSVGPEHAYLKKIKRVQYVAITDREALNAFDLLTKTEGIIPALESSHAIAFACHYAKTLNKNKTIVICLSGRGDKDISTVQKYL